MRWQRLMLWRAQVSRCLSCRGNTEERRLFASRLRLEVHRTIALLRQDYDEKGLESFHPTRELLASNVWMLADVPLCRRRRNLVGRNGCEGLQPER
jgi:hypothetical protein